jgi:hypothetical protein
MRQFTLKTLKAATAAALLAGASMAHAQIAVDVDIDVGEITILYAFNDVDVTLTSTALATILGGTGTCAAGTNSTNCSTGDAGGPVNATVNAGNLEAAFDISTNLGTVAPTNNINLVLQDVWAVRAVGGTSANTTVSVTVPGGTTITNGASSIGVTGAAATPSTFTDPGLGTPQTGDVTLTLDFSSLNAAGNHDSGQDAGDTVYTIDVTAT